MSLGCLLWPCDVWQSGPRAAPQRSAERSDCSWFSLQRAAWLLAKAKQSEVALKPTAHDSAKEDNPEVRASQRLSEELQ